MSTSRLTSNLITDSQVHMFCLKNDLILFYSLPGIHSLSNSMLVQCVVLIRVNIDLALPMYYSEHLTLFNLPRNCMKFYYRSCFPVEETESKQLKNLARVKPRQDPEPELTTTHRAAPCQDSHPAPYVSTVGLWASISSLKQESLDRRKHRH